MRLPLRVNIWKPGLALILAAFLFTGCIVDRDNRNTDLAASWVKSMEATEPSPLDTAKSKVSADMRAFCGTWGCAEHLIDPAHWLMEEISSGRWDTTPEKRPNLRPRLRWYLETYTDMEAEEIDGILADIEPRPVARKRIRLTPAESAAR